VPQLDNSSAARLELDITGHRDRIKEIMSRDVVGDFAGMFTRSTGQASAAFNGMTDEMAEAAAKAGGAAKKAAKDVADAMDPLAGVAARVYEQTRTPFERFEQQLVLLDTLLQNGEISWETYGRAVRQAQDEFDRASVQVSEGFGRMERASEQFSGTIADVFGGFVSGSMKVRDAIGHLIAGLIRLWQAAEQGKGGSGGGGFGNILKTIGGAVGGMFGGGGSVFGFGGGMVGDAASVGIPGGGFAMGGRPPVGKVSMVGEMGPELFVPDTAGTIIPNHELGGGGGGHVVVQLQLSGDLDARIMETSRQVSVQVVSGAAPGIVKQSTAATRDQFTRQRLIPVR
jgi:hypothetical protein